MVSVGTDHHPFDRLVGWMVEWSAEHPAHRVVVQRGTADEPMGVESHDLIPHDELRKLFGAATVVISHGGPSTVMDARMAGRLPIVVPRDRALGEHVDDHQVRFSRHLERHGLARCAVTRAQLFSLIDEALAEPSRFRIRRQDLETSSGVVRFGQVVDELLGIHTELVLDEPSIDDQRSTDVAAD